MPAMPLTIERRLVTVPGGYSLRAGADGKPTVFIGRAIVYNQWSEILYDCFRERIAPGAFDKSLASDRVLFCTVDHDPSRTLGRTGSGTLRIKPGADGIDVECDVSDYTYAKDLEVAIAREDLRGMSFIMNIIGEDWSRKEGDDGEKIVRHTVTEADLFEVSFVFTPAYEQTTAGVRGIPIAWPVAGELRAIEAAKRVVYVPSLAMRRRRLRLLEASLVLGH